MSLLLGGAPINKLYLGGAEIKKAYLGDIIIFDNSIIIPNTFIGGEGVNTTTATQLETLLGLTSGDVEYFNLNGNDIEALINVDYNLPSSAIRDNDDITSYIDEDGRLKNIGSFGLFNNSNLSSIKFHGLQTVSASSMRGLTSLEDFYLPSLTLTSGSAFRDSTSAKTFYIPNCATIGGGTGSSSVFLNLALNCVITCPASLETSNGGNREGDIAYAEDSRNATIIYV